MVGRFEIRGRHRGGGGGGVGVVILAVAGPGARGLCGKRGRCDGEGGNGVRMANGEMGRRADRAPPSVGMGIDVVERGDGVVEVMGSSR